MHAAYKHTGTQCGNGDDLGYGGCEKGHGHILVMFILETAVFRLHLTQTIPWR